MDIMETDNIASTSSMEPMSDETWPECWTVEQKNDFSSKHDWLTIRRSKLGCRPCNKIISLKIDKSIGMKIAKEWAFNKVTHYGKSRAQQLTSLRKKIYDHKESMCHKVAINLLAEADKERQVTAKIFRTAYKVAKENLSIDSFEAEIELQELNGIDMGITLNCSNDCHNIITHISMEMRRNLIKEILTSKSRFSIILDEIELSNKPTLSVYIRSCFLSNSNSSSTIFLDLIELQTPNDILQSLIICLQNYGITENYLNIYLVGILCESSSLLLGRKSDFSKLIKANFSSVVTCYFATHKLEYSVYKTINFIEENTRFYSFIELLNDAYHSVVGMGRELRKCDMVLEEQLSKIGNIFDMKMISSSFRTVLNVWDNYSILIQCFTGEQKVLNDENTRKYKNIITKMTSTAFILDLGLICDALQELSELNQELQIPNMNLYQVDMKIRCLLLIFEERRNVPGHFYDDAVKACQNLMFQGIQLYKSEVSDQPLSTDIFYNNLKLKIEDFLNDENSDFITWAQVLDSKRWPDNVELTFGDNEIRNLSKRLLLDDRDMIRAFRDYLSQKIVPANLNILNNALNVIPICSSECEKGLFELCNILRSTRKDLSIKMLSAILFIRCYGPPIRAFSPKKYVEPWILGGRLIAEDTPRSNKTVNMEFDDDLMHIWNLL